MDYFNFSNIIRVRKYFRVRVKYVDAQKVLSIISREEGPKLDFKVKLTLDVESAKKELARDVCAIANSKGGRGYMLIGIEDKTKKIIGITKDDFNEEKIQQIVSTRIEPPIPVSVDLVVVEKKLLGVLTIFNTDQKPHQLRENGAFYIRRGSTTDVMRKEEIATMLQENGLISSELLPVIKASHSDLDDNKITDFLKKSGLPEKLDFQILQSLGILSKEKDYNEYHPTLGAMLLFGRYPYYFLPHAHIKIHNKYNASLSGIHISKGTIFEVLEDALTFLKQSINNPDFPMDIVEDLLGNSVIHRDYFDINNCIDIYLSNKYLEIINPGSALKEFSRKDTYIRRNMWLYLKALAIDSKNNYFNKNTNYAQFTKKFGKIKYYNILSKNKFKVIIPLISINK